MNKKRNNTNGFTLAELLIVVAIIAVLAVIAIPVFGSRLENAREETDIANMRSAKAAAVAQYLANEDLDGEVLTSSGTTIYFDAISGALVKNAPSGYVRGTETDGGCEEFSMVINPTESLTQSKYTGQTNVAGKYIQVFINDTGTIRLSWEG